MTWIDKNRRDFLQLSGGAAMSMLGFQNMLGRVQTVMGTAPAASGQTAAQRTDPNKKLLGLMVDAARLPASLRYYRRVVEFCAEWGLNTLHFRLTDDQGSALQFESVPGLVTHRNAFTADELRSLVEYGRQQGVGLIPEVESFGHTGYITRSPRYAHLLDSDINSSTHFSGIIPVGSETLQLFDGIYREVAAIFPSVYFHGGCDEVNWGGSAMSRRALRTKTRPQIWGEYLNSLNEICRRLGKNFIVWGDYVLHKEPEILSLLNTDIIVMDWLYNDTNAITVSKALQKVRAHGARGIGAPALMHSGWGPRAGTEQLRNIDAFADSYLGAKEPCSLGVILTNWVPTRYLQDSIWDGYAYAAVAFTDGVGLAQTSAFQRFVEKHYAAEWNGAWSEIFEIIYKDAPRHGRRKMQDQSGLILPIPWSTDEELETTLKATSVDENPFTRLRSRLVIVEPLVRKNLSDFHSFALSVEYLERVFWRREVVVKEAQKKPLERATATLLIRSIAERDRALADRLSHDWDKGRPADSAGKTGPLFGLQPKRELLFQWEQAAIYSAGLAAHPDQFYQLLRTAMPG